jgi:hypothetical protein
MMNRKIIKRIREYCELSSLYDDRTGTFLTCNSSAHGPLLTKPFNEWNISTKDDWDRKMDIEFTWLVQNKKK